MNIKEPIANMTFGILICAGLICALIILNLLATAIGFGVVSLLGLKVNSDFNIVGFFTMFLGLVVYGMGWLARACKAEEE